MVRIRKEAEEAVRHARAAAGEAGRQGGQLAGRLAKVQLDIQTYNSVPAAQAGQVDVPALVKMRGELVEGKLTGRTRKRKRAKVVAVIGAAAVAAAAGVAAARRRNR